MGTRSKAEVVEVFYHRLMSETATMALGTPQLGVVVKSLRFFATSLDAVQVRTNFDAADDVKLRCIEYFSPLKLSSFSGVFPSLHP